jgi:drug/metabolite transporter (DMT)-like permease
LLFTLFVATITQSRAFSEQTIGILLVIISALGYAWLPIFAKWAYAEGLTPIDLLALRFAIAAPTMWLLTWRETEDSRTLPRVKLLLAGGLFAFVALTAFFSLALIPSSLYTLLLYTYPAMVVLLARLMGEPLSPQAILALILTLVGIGLTVPLQEGEFGGIDPFGVGLGLVNAALYAIYIMFSQRVLRGQQAVGHATRWNITGSLMVLVVIVAVQGLTLPVTWVGWASVVGIAIVCTVLPIFTFLTGIKRLGASKASILSSVEPLATLLLAVLLLGERLTWQQNVGGALILASVVVLQLKRKTA